MRQTTHYSKITRIEYEFEEAEIIRALMKDQDIPPYDKDRKRVEFEMSGNSATMTLVFAENLAEEK